MVAPVAIVYLDVDDEITSAAARIRAAEEVRVAIVLPAGSRLATSRINFRLLAREAQGRSRQLLIVSPEGATRALAASAGLTVYPTVRELEEAFATPEGEGGGGGPGGSGAAAGAAAAAGAVTAGGAAAGTSPVEPSAGEDAGTAAGAGFAAGARSGGKPRSGARGGAAEPDRTAKAATAAALAAADASAPTDARQTAGSVAAGEAYTTGAPDGATGPRSLGGRSAGASLPVVSSGRRRGGSRTLWAAAGLAILFVVVVVGVLGFLFLPAATIVVTPKVESIGPLTFTVTADPNATSTDVVNGVVPATVV
ncbi:MAG TPA: hypothetical protein VEG29_02875, partial [Candidatus Binatia bacterium]|nr:hypothetical protein [Candidatus Binatia bacterium]